MSTDIWTVMWKETKLLLEGNNRGKIGPLIFLAVFGVVLPLQTGRMWLSSPAGVAFWAIIPLVLVVSWVADSFAGERERHTLETLLASRLSDRAILFGKIIAGAGYAWMMALAAMVLGLATVNLANPHASLQLYAPAIGLGGAGLSFLMATLAANAGVLISLRAATVRQAQQTVGLGLMIVIWVPFLAFNFLPVEWRLAIEATLGAANLMQVAVAGVAALLALDIALLATAMARFQRTRLTLD